MCNSTSDQGLPVYKVTIKTVSQQVCPDGTVKPYVVTEPPLPTSVAKTPSNAYDNDEIKIGDIYEITHDAAQECNYWVLMSSGSMDDEHVYPVDVLTEICPCCGLTLQFDDYSPNGYCLSAFCFARILFSIRLFIIAIGLRLSRIEATIVDKLINRGIFQRTSDLLKVTATTLRHHCPNIHTNVVQSFLSKLEACKKKLTVSVYLESLNIPRDQHWQLNPVGIDFNFTNILEFIVWLTSRDDYTEGHYMNYPTFSKLKCFFNNSDNRQTVTELIHLGVL